MRKTCLLVLALALALPAWAQDGEPDAAVARLAENRASYQRAQARLAELQARYARGMNSHDLVGEERARVVAGIEAAKRELTDAREAHTELFEAARQSGAPWSVLERYEELPAPPAAPDRADEDAPDGLTVGSEDVDDAESAGSEASDDLQGDTVDADDAPEDEGEDLDEVDQAESEDSDDLRATSRDPD